MAQIYDTQTQSYLNMANAINSIADRSPSSNDSGLDLQTHALCDMADGLTYIANNGIAIGAATIEDGATIRNTTIVNPTLKDGSTAYGLTVPTLTKNTTIATAADIENMATRDGEETLLNKTLYDPILQNCNSVTMSLPDIRMTDTLVPNSWLANYARQEDLDNLHAVNTINDQTINGQKTFNAALWLKSNTIKTNNEHDLSLPEETSTLATQDWVQNEISNGGFITTDTDQELENKTLVNPTLKLKLDNGEGGYRQYYLGLPSKSGTLVTDSEIQDMVTTNGTQTLTNKTLTEDTLINCQLKNSSNPNYYTTIPELRSNDTLVTTEATQELDNKTLINPGFLTQVSENEMYFLQLPDHVDGVLATRAGEETLENKTLLNPLIKTTDGNNRYYNLSLPTKSGTLATTDDIINVSVDTTNFVTTDGTQTLSNKTLEGTAHETSGVHYVIYKLKRPNEDAVNIRVPLTDSGYILDQTSYQSINNKLLRGANKIYNGTLLSQSGNTITFPDSTCTLATTGDITNMVTTDGTQTLSNKTFEFIQATELSQIFGKGYIKVGNTTKNLYVPFENNGDGSVYLISNLQTQNLYNKSLMSSNKIGNGSLLSKSGRTITFPDKNCTLATTDDITNANGTLDSNDQLTNSGGGTIQFPKADTVTEALTVSYGVYENQDVFNTNYFSHTPPASWSVQGSMSNIGFERIITGGLISGRMSFFTLRVWTKVALDPDTTYKVCDYFKCNGDTEYRIIGPVTGHKNNGYGFPAGYLDINTDGVYIMTPKTETIPADSCLECCSTFR